MVISLENFHTVGLHARACSKCRAWADTIGRALLMTFVGFSIPGSDHVGFPEPADRCGVAGTLPPVQVSQKIIYII